VDAGVGVIWGNTSGVVTLAQGMREAMDQPQAELRVVNGTAAEAAVEGGIAAAVQAA
jgi:hypothetical protein